MKEKNILIPMEEIDKLCSLYQWLNLFVEQVRTEDPNYLQYLEDKKFPTRHDDLGRIHQELDLYRSLSLTFWKTLSKDQQRLRIKIEKEIQPKERQKIDIKEIKADVCEFRLKLDNPSTGKMMTSNLYTVYPEVRDRIYQQLKYIFHNTDSKEINDKIEITLFGEKDSFEARAAKLSDTIEKMSNDKELKKKRYLKRKKTMEELRKADYECYSNLHK